MADSIWYYLQTIKFMFLKDNPKSIIYAKSSVSATLGNLFLIGMIFLTLGSAISFFWIIGFSYTYIRYHQIEYDIYNHTLSKGEFSCTYEVWPICVVQGMGIFFLFCLCLITLFLIIIWLQSFCKDLNDSFESAQQMTEVYVDKEQKNLAKKEY